MVREFLDLQNFHVELAADAESGLAKFERDPPDLLILDIMLPGISGIEALKRLRQFSDVPVIMLTARGAESDRIIGLMQGADDYLAKPFSPLELTARIQAILRRARTSATPAAIENLTMGALTLDTRRREASVRGRSLALTAAEWRLLEQLMRHPDEVLTRAQLTERVLDRALAAYDRSIDTLISKLRKKMSDAELDESCIRGLRGHGYVLDQARLSRT
jgi:DNA-binding response OmpR family regulator